MLDRNQPPSARTFALFGFVPLLFFGILGGMFFWISGSLQTSVYLWSVGGLIAISYYSLKPLRLPIYGLWMSFTFAMNAVISLIVLGILYYGVLSPIGFLVRTLGKDPLTRQLERDRKSYWRARDSTPDVKRYIKQF